MTTKPYRAHEDATVESFRRDPAFALDYLNDVFEDGDEREVMLALRRIAQALGGVGEVAAKAELNPKTLYRTLSAAGNPELKTLIPLLRVLGMRLGVARLGETGFASSTDMHLTVKGGAAGEAHVFPLCANRRRTGPITFSSSGGLAEPVLREVAMA